VGPNSGGVPRRPAGFSRAAHRVFPKPVVVVAAILLPVAVIGLVTYLQAVLLAGAVPFAG
jgi:hypothetical protein